MSPERLDVPIEAFKLWRLPNYLKLNLVAAVSFLLAYLLNLADWPYLLMIVGIIIFLLPGINLGLAINQLSGMRQAPLSLLLWVIILSLILTPAATETLSRLVFQGSPFHYNLLAFLLWWALTLVITALFHPATKKPGEKISFDLGVPRKELIGLLLGFGLIVGVAMLLYPFIPEADSYTYLMRLRTVEADPSKLATEGRSLFLILTDLMTALTRISGYWLYKLVLPLAHFVIALSVYLASQPLLKVGWQRVAVSLLPFVVPVILQELLISRPQSVFVLTFSASLYLAGQLSLARTTPGASFWLVALVALGVLGLQIHALFVVVILLSVIGALVLFWPKITQRPFQAVAIAAMVATALYPWVASTGILGDLKELGYLLINTLKEGHFTFWFLDNYRNVDGNEAGWPGITALFFYSYNLGLFLPALFVGLMVWRQRQSVPAQTRRGFWPIFLSLGLFLLVAEVAPRFGLAFLPDRAWLFLALSLSALTPLLIARLKLVRLPQPVYLSLIAAASLSLAANWGVTYAKQGWLEVKDYPVIEFIRAETPPNSVFLTQGSNHVLIRYYTERRMIRPPEELFMSSDAEAVERYLAERAETRRIGLVNNAQKRADFKLTLGQAASAYENASLVTRETLKSRLEFLQTAYEAAIAEFASIEYSYPTAAAPTYILYSRNKFDSLYGQRAWWLNSNFFGANLEKFTSRYPIIYNQHGVTVWEVRR